MTVSYTHLPLLTDVQALVARAPFGTPRRMASGVDQGRLSLLLAVLEKRAGLRLFDQDVYILSLIHI